MDVYVDGRLVGTVVVQEESELWPFQRSPLTLLDRISGGYAAFFKSAPVLRLIRGRLSRGL